MMNKYNILIEAKAFSSNELQNYFVFQLFISDFLTKNRKIDSLTSKGMSLESITPPIYNRKNSYFFI